MTTREWFRQWRAEEVGRVNTIDYSRRSHRWMLPCDQHQAMTAFRDQADQLEQIDRLWDEHWGYLFRVRARRSFRHTNPHRAIRRLERMLPRAGVAGGWGFP